MNNLKDYAPSIYNGVLEFERLFEAENKLFDLLEKQVLRVKNNQYIVTSDLEGLSEWERMLNIIPNPSVEDRQFRVDRIINRLSMTPPYTFNYLKLKFDEIIGVGKWKAWLDYDNYTLYVESSAINQVWLNEIIITITKIKPANIVFTNKPFVSKTMLLNETINLTELVYNYRLGTTWVLGKKPFADVQERGVIKMPNNESLKPHLLNRVATFTKDEIAKVRLNQTHLIDIFTIKSVAENLITIEYQVPKTLNVGEITKIEMLDTSNNVLSNSQVYVPVLDNIILKHTLEVREGVN